MAQINLRLDDSVVKSFHKFCHRYDIKGYTLLGMIVKVYARVEELRENLDNGLMTREDALLKLGALIEELRQVSRIDREFLYTVDDLAKRLGISPADLGFDLAFLKLMQENKP